MYNGQSTVFPNRFGQNAKAIYGSYIQLITDVDAEQVQSFACSKYAVFYVLKAPQKPKVSLIPEKPQEVGLTHFYKQNGEWVFMSESEWNDADNKKKLPNICFATRHNIKDFSSKVWPDLDRMTDQLIFSCNGSETYYAKYRIGGAGEEADSVREAQADLDQMLNKSSKAEMNPIIWVRTATPSRNLLEVLEPFTLTDYFEQASNDETIKFFIEKKDLPWDEIA